MYLCICLSIYLSIYRSIHRSIYLSTYLPTSIYLSIYLFIYLSIYLSNLSLSLSLSVWLSVYLPVYLQAWKPSYSARLLHFSKLTTPKAQQFCATSSFFKVDSIKNEAIPRDVLNVWTWQRQKRNNYARPPHFRSWQHQKRSNSARLPYFSKLTTSKTKQLCETSSFFEFDNIKNKWILRGFLQKWKVECRAGSLVPTRFAIFPVHLSKVLRLPRKSDAKSYKVLHLSRKIISANLKIWCSKMQPLSGNQRPDLLTSLMGMSFVLRLPREMHLWRSSSNVSRLPSLLEMLQNSHVLLTFDKVHNPLHLPRGSTSERPKVLRTRHFFALLTWKCASRHNGVHFFDISTSKSGPNPRCF